MYLRSCAAAVWIAAFCLISPVKALEMDLREGNYFFPTDVQLKPIKPITISQAEFGVFRVNSQGKLAFVATDEVTRWEGQRYGWQIKLKDYKGKVTWREVIVLPQQPLTWATDNGEHFVLSKDGKQAIIERTQSAANGVINNFWRITPGDPPGKYKIKVYVDEQQVGVFNFELVVPLKE